MARSPRSSQPSPVQVGTDPPRPGLQGTSCACRGHVTGTGIAGGQLRSSVHSLTALLTAGFVAGRPAHSPRTVWRH